MILIGPGTLLLLVLLAFRPFRIVAGFLLLLVALFTLASCEGWIMALRQAYP